MDLHWLRSCVVLRIAFILCFYNHGNFQIHAQTAPQNTNNALMDEISLLLAHGKSSEAMDKFEKLDVNFQQASIPLLVKGFYKPSNVHGIIRLAREMKNPQLRALVMQHLENEMKDCRDNDSLEILSIEKEVQKFYDKFEVIDVEQIPVLVKNFYEPEYVTGILHLARKKELSRVVIMESLVNAMMDRQELEILPVLSVENEAKSFLNKAHEKERDVYSKILNEIKDPVDNVLKEVAEQIRNNSYKDGTIKYFQELINNRIDPEYYVKLVQKTYKPTTEIESNIINFVVHYSLDYDAKPAYFLQLCKEMKEKSHFNLKTIIRIAYETFFYLEVAETLDGPKQKYYQYTSDEVYKTYVNRLREALPQGLRQIVWRLPVCIQNGAYQSDYLVVKDHFDKSRDVVVTTSRPEGKILSYKWRFIQEYEKWQIRPEKTGNRTMYVEEEFVPCTSGKRRALTKPTEKLEWNWELHDYDWLNGVYLLYNNKFKEYLHADSQQQMYPNVQRHVYTKAILGDVPAVATWKISSDCFRN